MNTNTELDGLTPDEVRSLSRQMLDASEGDVIGALYSLVDGLLEKQSRDLHENGNDVMFVGTFGSEFHIQTLQAQLETAAHVINFDRSGLLLARGILEAARGDAF